MSGKKPKSKSQFPPVEKGEVAVTDLPERLQIFAREAVRCRWLAFRRGPGRVVVVKQVELDAHVAVVSKFESPSARAFVVKHKNAVEKLEAIVSSGVILSGEPRIQIVGKAFPGSCMKEIRRLFPSLITE